jgi:membrane-associated phospholipid phosphatase
MLDAMDLLCPVLRTHFFGRLMTVFGYYGQSVFGIAIGLALTAHGYVYNNERSKRAGIATLIVLALAGTIAEALKHTLPPPYVRPSGRTAAAFALASVLSFAFPATSPVFFGLAILTAISRLYWRAPSTWNVISGAVIGFLAGVPVAKQLIPRADAIRPSWLWLGGWIGALLTGVSSLAFFYHAESQIAAHRVAINGIAQHDPMIANLDLGTAQARPSLRYGWSGDESWNEGQRSVIWATGLGSELIMSLPAAENYRFRFDSFPYSPEGAACQRIEVRVNGQFVASVWLEKGWHWYQIDVPQKAVHAGRNFIQFFYDYAESPKSRGTGSDERALSVAFDTLQVLAKN